MTILNLTPFDITPDLAEAGVVDVRDKEALKRLFEFDSPPEVHDLDSLAEELIEIALAEKADTVMIGGCDFLMPYLEAWCEENHLTAVYSFKKNGVHVDWIDTEF